MLTDGEVIATYDFSDDAVGLANFILAMHNKSEVVIVRDQDYRAARKAICIEETLSDGSKVYNLEIHFED